MKRCGAKAVVRAMPKASTVIPTIRLRSNAGSLSQPPTAPCDRIATGSGRWSDRWRPAPRLAVLLPAGQRAGSLLAVVVGPAEVADLALPLAVSADVAGVEL